MMVDFSEYGIVSLISNFVLITLLFMTIIDGYHFFKHKKRFISFLAFGILLVSGSTVAVLTSLIAINQLSIILSVIYTITLIIGIKYKKTITILWVTLILLCIAFFIGFIQYLVLGETGKTIAILKVNKISKEKMKITVTYRNQVKSYSSKGEMLGFEAFQLTFKPFMHSLFGGKRFLLNSVFTEQFNQDNNQGRTFYHSLGKSFFKKRAIWNRLRRKKLLLFGVKGVQRVMVSVYPSENQTYELKVTNQGLILIPQSISN